MAKHEHYYKDVSQLTEIDVYRVCDLFKVDDPSGATQHAIKKLLLPGGRGAKGKDKDLQEAVDTLVRRIAMEKEGKEGMNTVFGMSYIIDAKGCATLENLEMLRRLGAKSVLITRELEKQVLPYASDTELK